MHCTVMSSRYQSVAQQLYGDRSALQGCAYCVFLISRVTFVEYDMSTMHDFYAVYDCCVNFRVPVLR